MRYTMERGAPAEVMWRVLKWRLDGGSCGAERGEKRRAGWGGGACGSLATAALSALRAMWRGRVITRWSRPSQYSDIIISLGFVLCLQLL
jgi:hypothetical protein